MKLYKVNKNSDAQLLIPSLEVADNFYSRLKGLLGRHFLEEEKGLWIRPGNNIHSFFMKFSIDCIFIDKNLVVQKIYEDVRPFSVAGPVWRSTSVIEVAAGQTKKWNLKSGDQLYVVS